ncbi:MAG: polysialyltransferase family glycosyltransferase, partial [Agriterribacter sp.]
HLKKCLIKVPHTLNGDGFDSFFEEVLVFKPFYTGFSSLFRYAAIKKQLGFLRKTLDVNPGEVLLDYTDYEVLNQYIIALFTERGGRVILMEDGMATVCVANLPVKPLHWKNQLTRVVLRKIYGFNFLQMREDGEVAFPMIDDTYIQALALSIKANIRRTIPVYQLKIRLGNGLHNKQKLLFINQDLYNFNFFTLGAFAENLAKLLKTVAPQFREVFFKFHPRERPEDRTFIAKVLSPLGISVVNDNGSVEELVESMEPGYVASFYSSGLKSLYFKGIEPFFLYHLFPVLSGSDLTRNITSYLKSINYNFVTSLEEVRPGYRSGITMTGRSHTLYELIQIVENQYNE